jgi:hypothetical protein
MALADAAYGSGLTVLALGKRDLASFGALLAGIDIARVDDVPFLPSVWRASSHGWCSHRTYYSTCVRCVSGSWRGKCAIPVLVGRAIARMDLQSPLVIVKSWRVLIRL